jgi:protease-4
MSQWLNRDWYEQVVGAIAERRGKTADEIRQVIDRGPFLAEGARREGLIDELAYEDQLDDKPPVQGTRRLEDDDYRRSMSTVGPAGAPRIAVLYAVGTIASGKSVVDPFGGSVVGSETFNEWLRKVRLDSTIRAVVVRVDSPGGSAIASEVMWRELMLTREAKPLIVSMGDVAASGGYYIAAPAHHIVAQPGTITGSIGVVTGKFVVDGTLDKLGIGVDSVSNGRQAEIYSPFRPFTKDERARVSEQMQTTYDLFVSRVAEGRKSTPAKIDAVAQGRVWTGRQAREHGLVDELGGLDAALQAAKLRARLDPAKDVQLVVYPPKRSVFDLLTNPLGVSARGPSAWLTRPEAKAVQSLLSLPRLFHRGEPLLIMPNVFWR